MDSALISLMEDAAKKAAERVQFLSTMSGKEIHACNYSVEATLLTEKVERLAALGAGVGDTTVIEAFVAAMRAGAALVEGKAQFGRVQETVSLLYDLRDDEAHLAALGRVLAAVEACFPKS